MLQVKALTSFIFKSFPYLRKPYLVLVSSQTLSWIASSNLDTEHTYLVKIKVIWAISWRIAARHGGTSYYFLSAGIKAEILKFTRLPR